MTDDDDPIKAAVEQSLREQITAWWQTPPRLDLAADIAAQAHRRAVLDRRDDGETGLIAAALAARDRLRASNMAVSFGRIDMHITDANLRTLLAALADAEIARRQVEADAQRLREQNKAVRTKAAALLDGELAHRSRDYGRGVAQATWDILAALDGGGGSRPGTPLTGTPIPAMVYP